MTDKEHSGGGGRGGWLWLKVYAEIKSIMVGKAWQSALCVSEAADDMSPQGGGREGTGSESKL